MKLIYCINATYNSGGMERVLMTKANYLSDIVGYEIVIITSQQHGKANFFPFSKRIQFYDLGINYDDIKGNLILQIFKKWLKKRRHKHLLTDYLYQLKPDICISMFDYDFDFLYKIKDGSKKVLELHFCKKQKIIEASNLIIRFLQTLRIGRWEGIVAKYDKFVVLTEEDRCSWKNLKNIVVIKNPILRIPDTKSKCDSKCVLSIGRISYQKGFDQLIKAWKIVISHFPEWKLTIVGGGDSTALKKQINDLSLTGKVTIKPATNKIEEEYLNCSVYIMASRYEGLGMVLMEAMSYGIPVVAFACPCGPKDLIQSQYGTLVENGNINALASALMDWMDNEEKRKIGGEKGREYIGQFILENIMEQWLSLFKSLLT